MLKNMPKIIQNKASCNLLLADRGWKPFAMETRTVGETADLALTRNDCLGC